MTSGLHEMLKPFVLIVMGLGNTGGSAADLGTDRQLLCDSSIVAVSHDLVWTVNPPEPVDTVMWPDKAWEDFTLSYFSILDDNGLYRMWYGAYERAPVTRRICYAESVDGLIWLKPNLGLVEHDGTFDNNILPIDVSDGGYVFIDPLAVPSGRYKFLGIRPFPTVYESHDGLDWTLVDTALLDFLPDSHNLLFYDDRLGTYVAYLRSWNWLEEYDSLAIPNRTVSRMEIADPSSFWSYTPIDSPYYRWGPDHPPAISTELDIVLAPDTLDPPDIDIYTPCVIKYEGAANAYFAFPSIFYHYPPPPAGEFVSDGRLNVELAFSRDGVDWSRYRTPYLDHDCFGDSLRQMYMAPSMLKIGDYYYQYFNGLEETHGDSAKTSHYFCVRQRIDGFISLDASGLTGSLRTFAFTFEGNSLNLNYAVQPGGYVSAGLFDAAGDPIPGFGIDDCDTLYDDQVSGVVSWQGNRDIEALEGATVVLGLALQNAAVYAFQFQLDPTLDVSPDLLVADDWLLKQNYPNPFNPTTTIQFHLPRRSEVCLTVFNVLGQPVTKLLDVSLPAGEHRVVWSGTDVNDSPVAGGVYFYRLTTEGFARTRKMVLVK